MSPPTIGATLPGLIVFPWGQTLDRVLTKARRACTFSEQNLDIPPRCDPKGILMSDSALPHRSARSVSVAAVSHEAAARSLLFVAATISFVLSVSLWFFSDQLQGIFVGLWVPSILALGAIVLPRKARP
jgi:hypothetical protein